MFLPTRQPRTDVLWGLRYSVSPESRNRFVVIKRPSLGLSLILLTSVLVAVGEWRIHSRSEDGRIAVIRHPRDVMGTNCRLIVVVPEPDQFHARDTLKRAEASIRSTESHMSNWIEQSEVTRIASAPTGEPLTLSLETLYVIDQAKAAYRSSMGAFDVTCAPQLALWRAAEDRNEMPSQEEIDAAVAASSWSLIERTEMGIVKMAETVSIDLGGVAKGHAIDQALEELKRGGVSGALVDIGGDLACFGNQPNGQEWLVTIRDPFHDDALAKLRVTDRAVATSGNYARYRDIEGQRYSHIVDPRTGMPTTATESVTVIGPSAIVADIWATALSVLGSGGLERLPDGVDALVVTGPEEDSQVTITAGIQGYLEEAVPDGWSIYGSEPGESSSPDLQPGGSGGEQ